MQPERPRRADVLPTGPPVQPRYQIGREGDIARLAEELREHEHTVLAGPRRIGKSTVVLGALELLADDGVTVCAIDCRQTPTPDALAMELDAQRLANLGELRQEARKLGGFALRLWRTVLAGEENPDMDERLATEVAGRLAETENSDTVADGLTAVEAAGGESGAVVFFDEAQRLHELGDVVTAIRGVMLTPDSRLTFVFAGSEESLMESLFSEGGLLEVQGQPFELGPIPPHLWVEGLRTHCRDYLGVTISRQAVELIVDAAGGHPYRTMMAANRAHQRAQELVLSDIDDAVARDAIERARRDRRWSLP